MGDFHAMYEFYAIGGHSHFIYYNFIVSKTFIEESIRWKQQRRPKCCIKMGRPSREMQHLHVFRECKVANAAEGFFLTLRDFYLITVTRHVKFRMHTNYTNVSLFRYVNRTHK
jgi:hypothetical protein